MGSRGGRGGKTVREEKESERQEEKEGVYTCVYTGRSLRSSRPVWTSG